MDILNRWQKPGDITNVPRMDAGRTADFDAASDRWLTDASYLNIRTITLSYELPRYAGPKSYSCSNAQIYVSGENFLILSNRKGHEHSAELHRYYQQRVQLGQERSVGISL